MGGQKPSRSSYQSVHSNVPSTPNGEPAKISAPPSVTSQPTYAEPTPSEYAPSEAAPASDAGDVEAAAAPAAAAATVSAGTAYFLAAKATTYESRNKQWSKSGWKAYKNNWKGFTGGMCGWYGMLILVFIVVALVIFGLVLGAANVSDDDDDERYERRHHGGRWHDDDDDDRRVKAFKAPTLSNTMSLQHLDLSNVHEELAKPAGGARRRGGRKHRGKKGKKHAAEEEEEKAAEEEEEKAVEKADQGVFARFKHTIRHAKRAVKRAFHGKKHRRSMRKHRRGGAKRHEKHDADREEDREEDRDEHRSHRSHRSHHDEDDEDDYDDDEDDWDRHHRHHAFRFGSVFNIGMLLANIVGSVFTSLIVAPLLASVFHGHFKFMRGDAVSVRDMFAGFRYFRSVYPAVLLADVLASIGYFFLIIPGVYIQCATFLVVPLVMEHPELCAFKAAKLSIILFNKKLGSNLLLVLPLALLNMVAVWISFGLLLVVTLPVTIGIFAAFYKDVLTLDGAVEDPEANHLARVEAKRAARQDVTFVSLNQFPQPQQQPQQQQQQQGYPGMVQYPVMYAQPAQQQQQQQMTGSAAPMAPPAHMVVVPAYAAPQQFAQPAQQQQQQQQQQPTYAAPQ